MNLSFDELRRRHEEVVRGVAPISLVAFLSESVAALTEEQRREFIQRDIELRRQAGAHVSVQDYLPAFAGDADWIEGLLTSSTIGPAENMAAKESPSDLQTPRENSLSSSGGSGTKISDPKSPLQAILKRLKPGTTFGSYDLLEVLGKGGMGVVFKAKQRTMSRVVALKVVGLSAGSHDATLARFRREAKAASRLLHPNIVAAFDADECEGIPYLALEYVAGPNLRELVKSRGALPIESAVRYVRDAARGLGYAHSRGVIHRDVKPSNILLDEQAEAVKILDLGLARVEALLEDASQATELTSTGVMFGTVDFMSPEQARDAKRADARSDIYSLGCTLYFLLTGETLFRGETILQKIRQHQEAPVPRIAAARTGVPNRLEVVLARMVAKQPEDRFQTMDEVATALDDCLATLQGTLADTEPVIEATVIYRPAEESTQTITHRVPATPNRTRGWWLGGSVLMVTALAFMAWLAFRPKVPSEKIDLTGTGTAPSSEKTTNDTPNETPKADVAMADVEPLQPVEWKKPDGLETVLAPQLVERDRPLSARATVQNPPRLSGVRSWTVELAGARSSISRVEHSEAARLYAVCTNGGSHIQIYDDQLKLVKLLVGVHGNASNGNSPTLAWSPDGALLATVDWGDYRGAGLRIWDVKSGTVLLHRPRLAAWVPSVAWSPDGKLLAVGGHSVELLDIHSGLSRSLKTNHGNRVAWSPDSQRVAVSNNDSQVSIYDATDLQVVRAITAEKAEVRPPFVWSPDGKQFLTGSTKSGEAHLFDGESFAFQKSLKLNQQPADFLWTNDPNRVVVGGQKTIVWNLKDDQLATNIGAGGAVSWVKPNESLVIGRSDGVLEVRSIAGLPIARSQDRGQPRAELAALSHDGRELVIARNTDLQFFDAESGTPKESLKNVIAKGARIVWSPNGERLAAVTDKEVAVLDRKSGKSILTLAGHTDSILSLRWSPDATQIVTTSKDKSLRVWDVMATVETTQQTLNEPVLEAAWSHSGKVLAAALKRELLLLSADGKQIVSRHALPADFTSGEIGQKSLCWSADDALLTCSNHWNPQYVFDVARGSIEPFHRNNLEFYLRSPFDWSPDGRQLVGHSDYNESYVIDRGTRALRRIGYTHRPQFLPDSRRLLSHGFGSIELWGIDSQTGRVIGSMYPSLSTSTKPVVISSDGHVRGPSRSVLYVAQTDAGSLLTLTAAEFEKRFGWKNDPTKAALLRLPDSAPSPPSDAKPNDNVFATLDDPQWKSVELPADDAKPSERSRSGSALVPRPATINGLRWWTIETEGHRGAVDVLAFSPTCQLIASAGEDGTIRLWDERGRLRRVLTDAFANAAWLDWSRDGRSLASAHGAQVRLWDVANGRRLRAVTLPANVLTLSWSADASRLAVGMENNRWGVIDARTGQLTEIATAGERVAWSPDGSHIATGQGFTITIREAERLIPIRAISVPSDVTGLGSLSWSPDGSVLVAGFGSNQSRVGVWNAITGEWIGDLEPRTGTTTQFSWSRDGQRVSNGFHVWDISTRQAIASSPLSDKRSVLSPNGSLLAGLYGTRLALRDVSTGQAIADGSDGIASVPRGRLTIGGQSLVLLDGYGIGRLDSTSGIARDELILYNQSWQALAPDYFGDFFAVKAENSTGTLNLLNRDRRPAKPLIGHTDYINDLAWSPDGKLLATASRDGTLRVWNREQDQPLHTFDHQKKSVTGLAWSADSERIATIASSDQPLRVWSLKTGKAEVEVGKIASGVNVAWQPDGKSLLIGRPTLPPLSIDLATGATRERNALSGRITASPNGQFIAMNSGVESTGSNDLESFPGELTDRRTVSEWFPDSKRLTVTAAGALRVYSAEHHRYLGALLTSLPRGNRLIVGPHGHWRSFPAERVGLVYIAETDAGQFELFSPEEFEKRFGWKNLPEQATLSDLSVEPAPESVSPQPRYEDDRAAALDVLAKQGRVRIRLHGAERDVTSVDLLPLSPFEVIGVYFQGRPITNDDLSFLRPLKSLRELSLWSCSKITDGVLEIIGDHPQLRRLEVHFTSLTDNGLMALPRFPQLEQLQLDGLPVSDAIAPALTQLHRLTSLTMNGLQLGDAPIHTLAELPSLSSLHLRCPKATDASAADFAKMRSLQRLDFTAPVGAEVLRALSDLPQLSALLLYGNKPTDSGDVEVGPMPAMRSLVLEGATFNEVALRRLGESPVLEYVALKSTNLTDASLAALLQSRSLRTLDLNRAPLLSPKAFPSLADSRLVNLTMTGVAIDDDSVRHILEAPALKSLQLTGAAFTGVAFDGFDNLPLETLRIHGALIAAEHAPAFAKLKNLRAITADETIITAIASGLAQLPSLRSLECAQAKSLAGTGQVKQPQTLYLYGAGSLPATEYQHLAGMDRLESLQVHAANFTQEHFDQLRKLTGPRKLILQDGTVTQPALDKFKAEATNWTVTLNGCKVVP